MQSKPERPNAPEIPWLLTEIKTLPFLFQTMHGKVKHWLYNK